MWPDKAERLRSIRDEKIKLIANYLSAGRMSMARTSWREAGEYNRRLRKLRRRPRATA